MYTPAGSPVETSRLGRSNNAQLTTLEQIIAFCIEHNIPYSLPADFKERVLPSPALQEVFTRSYGLARLPPTTLRHKGSSTIIALERKAPNPKANNHGEVIATISDSVGKQLQPRVDVIYIQTDPNPAYREAHHPDVNEPLKRLLEQQGVPVIFSCVEWDDAWLLLDGITHDGQFDHLGKFTGFFVDSAGNDGLFGADGQKKFATQKHRASSHAPPLAVSVGAVEQTENGTVIAGWSSANGPTLLAPVAHQAKIKWDSEREAESATGTSAACPYVGGVLAALNAEYGAYLTREQILYAVIATCEPILNVAAFGSHTLQPYTITYPENAAGLKFNAWVGGFGEIKPYRADKILAHMVAITQQNSNLITDPIPTSAVVFVPNPTQQKPSDGLYTYELELPADGGIALKTTLEVEYVGQHGQIYVTSPSGTTLPMVTSMLPIFNIKALTEEKAYFGLSTTHGWAGENLGGKWRITSPTPIRRLRFNNHHFLEGDIIHNLDVARLLKTPVPYDALGIAIPLVDLKPTLREQSYVAAQPHRQLAIAI